MIRAGIMGASGYAGEELLRILLRHPEVSVEAAAAKIDMVHITRLYPWTRGMLDLECGDFGPEEIAKKCDCVFLALPHKVSMQFVPFFLESGKKVIDLSADFRLRDAAVYERWYETKHTCTALIKKAVYGLPEFYRDEIKKADLIANPGCYPTSIILGCAPLIKEGVAETDSIVSDSKSGVSGAGRVPQKALMFTELQNSLRAYKPNQHRHMPEIDQELSRIAGGKARVNFIPHLVPMERGILSTIYVKLNKKISTDEALDIYRDFYRKEYFVRIMEKGVYPDTKNVVRSNFCDIGVEVFPDRSLVVVMSAIDNLVKGASGQAVQNMNIMYGLKEETAL